jgi:diguanylate cyclase (GGDEF)-like protein/PAS domain S-box-containing protein
MGLPQRRHQAPLSAAEFAEELVATSPALVLVLDEYVRYANAAAARTLGRQVQELGGLDLDQLLHPESRELAAELLDQLDRGVLESHQVDLRIRRRGGASRWLRLSVAPIELRGRVSILASGLDDTEHRQTREALDRSQESLRLVQRAAHSVHWQWEAETDRLELSGFADELFGFAVQNNANSGTDFTGLVHPEDRQRLRRELRMTLKQDSNLAIDLRFVTPSGEVRWLAARGVAVRDESGWAHRIIGVAHDISERRIAEEALFQEKEKADVTLASIADGVLRTDARGMVDYLNPVAQKLTGWSLAEAYGRPAEEIYRVVDPQTGRRLLDPLSQCLGKGRESVFVDDRLLADRDGGRHPVQDSAAPIRDRRGEIIGAVLTFRDLSRLHEIQREVSRLASHDSLTGLINRRAFVARLERVLTERAAQGTHHAVCHLDLDNFRLVNETGGQAAGDRLIQQTARLIQANLSDRDLVAHLGGDSFAVLFRDCPPSRAHNLAEEIRHAVRGAPFVSDGRTFSCRASIGLVAIGPDPVDPVALLRDAGAGSAAALMRDADAACVVAKEKGGNRIHNYQPGDSAVAERFGQMQWVSRINKAFDEDRFTLYHQKIVPVQGAEKGEAPLSELLVRMIDEQGQLVGPGSFIPAAERFGLVAEIDRWVLATALRQLADSGWADDEQRPRFTLNISGFSLGASDFLDLVIAEFETTGVDPGQILFEITETAAIADLTRAQRFLSALRGMGCHFILDDFGKGLSSLGYLRNLPLDYLKIDGSFVRNMTVDPIQTALVASIHEIADVMGLRTIAEFVEDEETLDAVRRLGIDYAQGFLLARPEPLPVSAASSRADGRLRPVAGP